MEVQHVVVGIVLMLIVLAIVLIMLGGLPDLPATIKELIK